MPLALTGYETALLVVALVFIVFALVVSLVVPRSRPDFPSNRLGIFIGVCVVLFVAQLGAVLALAEIGEADEPVHEEAGPTEPGEPEAPQGDPVAGKEVFLSVAQPPCGSCHTLADAETSGTIGPNLDSVSPSYDQVVEVVTNGRGVMPAFEGNLSEEQISDVAAYVSSTAGS